MLVILIINCVEHLMQYEGTSFCNVRTGLKGRITDSRVLLVGFKLL